MRRYLRVACLVAGLALSACARIESGPADKASFPSDIAGSPALTAVTTRQPVPGGRPWFDAERAARPSAARVRLSSPHLAGRFSLAAAGIVDWGIERVEPAASLASALPRTEGRRDVLLYVHGYNETFESAALDAARLSDGLGFRGETVLFSWPSRAKILDYLTDRESAMWSRDALETVLDDLVSHPSVGTVHVVAHSMGSMVTVEALRQLHLRLGEKADGRLGAIVFASPDVDVDGFSASVRKMGTLNGKMVVVLASDDRALAVSATLAGRNRVGAAERSRIESLGIRVVDASGLSSGLVRHDLFLSNADVRRVVASAVAEERRKAREASERVDPVPPTPAVTVESLPDLTPPPPAQDADLPPAPEPPVVDGPRHPAADGEAGEADAGSDG